MSDLEFLTGICQKVLNPLPEEEEYEEEAELPPGYEEDYYTTPWNEQIKTYRKWGF